MPLIIVSPYAKPGNISHTLYSFESMLSFAENVFGLAPLLSTDTLANNLADSFNFNQTPLPPLILQPHTCPAIVVNCPDSSAQAGVTYSSTASASGGVAPYTFYTNQFTAGAPPNGLAPDPVTGVMTGTPSAAGTFSYSLEAVDSTGAADAVLCKLQVASAAAVTLGCTSPTGEAGVPYSSALAAGGGVPPYTFSISSGALPPGLSLNPSTGAISGVPQTAGTFAFTSEVADSTNSTATVNCSITVAPSLALGCPASAGQVDTPYSSALVSTGGIPPFAFSIAAGALPSGLALNLLTGAIAGVPSAAGSFPFTAQVVDSAAGLATANCGMGIAASPTSTVLSASPSPANLGQQVTLSAQVSPAPGSGIVTFYDGIAVLGSASAATALPAYPPRCWPPRRIPCMLTMPATASFTSSASIAVPLTVQSAAASTFLPGKLYGQRSGNLASGRRFQCRRHFRFRRGQ